MASNNGGSSNPPTVPRKIALLGHRNVGKTQIVVSFVTGGFSEQYEPTIESVASKTIRFRKVHFATDLVDTAGMDEFSRLSRNSSLGVHGYALVFSICSRPSFEMIQTIHEGLLHQLGDLKDIPRVLVGSMKDMNPSRHVSIAEAQKLADKWHCPYIECSAKTGESVAEVFHTLLKEIEKDDGLLAESGDGRCTIQ